MELAVAYAWAGDSKRSAEAEAQTREVDLRHSKKQLDPGRACDCGLRWCVAVNFVHAACQSLSHMESALRNACGERKQLASILQPLACCRRPGR